MVFVQRKTLCPYYSNEKIFFQSSFMLMTVQPCFLRLDHTAPA